MRISISEEYKCVVFIENRGSKILEIILVIKQNPGDHTGTTFYIYMTLCLERIDLSAC